MTADASTKWSLQIVREATQPTLTLGSEWIESISIGSNGNAEADMTLPATKPNGQSISPKTWGIVFVCVGTGKGYIHIDTNTAIPNVGRINTPICDGRPKFDVVRYSYATNIRSIQVVVTGDIVWDVKVVACANEQKCGT